MPLNRRGRRWRLAAVATAVSAVSIALAVPATADPVLTPTGGTYPPGFDPSEIYAGVGADADAEMLNYVVKQAEAAPDDPTGASNTLASYDAVNPVTGNANSTTSPELVDTKPGCEIVRPNGANAALTAILSNDASYTSDATKGGDGTSPCIDWVRASRFRDASKPAEQNLTFYAWARDALGYVTLRNSYAPEFLTKDQLYDIFTCEVSDWSQVGGQKGAIHLYFAPSTAATFTEFLKAFGITSYNDALTPCADSGRLYLDQQNDGRTLRGDPQGIAPYAITKWAGQANGGSYPELNLGIPDLRAGTTVGKVGNGDEPVVTKTVGSRTFDVLNGDWATGDRSTFGRILWNAVRNTAPTALKDVFDQDSWLCAHRDELITPFGATPLGPSTTPDSDGRFCGQGL